MHFNKHNQMKITLLFHPTFGDASTKIYKILNNIEVIFFMT